MADIIKDESESRNNTSRKKIKERDIDYSVKIGLEDIIFTSSILLRLTPHETCRPNHSVRVICMELVVAYGNTLTFWVSSRKFKATALHPIAQKIIILFG